MQRNALLGYDEKALKVFCLWLYKSTKFSCPIATGISNVSLTVQGDSIQNV